jgi:hypothetical protein
MAQWVSVSPEMTIYACMQIYGEALAKQADGFS